MKLTLVVVVCIVLTLVLSVVSIVHADSSSGKTSGIRARLERLSDPYSRAKYFGFNYTKPLFGFGVKDVSNGGMAKGNYGAKGVAVRNKLYNALISQGRNPGKISHYDSSWKGSKNIDTTVELKPAITITRDNKNSFANGFVRINSQEYEQNAQLPFTEVYVTVANAPPSNKTEIAGAWLVDEDTGYTLRLGNFLIGLRGTGSLTYRMYQFIGPYDTVMVTREPVQPSDPFPHEPVLIGDLQ